ncbi:DUF6430 domain-containing protein [Actinokineospora sp. PR83]|uniref:macro domain-containing protein n=1 Tax=Actinokineospora sp. PR83 TaxID=2884908 RepID=UPI001F41E6EE|nr:macro domain-containing protein [Actinokineospora sp. PR83]MCG8918592.1 DUF6430 domain-containing protein [Actinokineospora sp. PR83]
MGVFKIRRLRQGFSTVFCSRRGVKILLRDALATFGVIGGSLQVYDILTPNANYQPALMVLALGVTPVAVGLHRAWPRLSLVRHLERPNVSIQVLVGDLFEQKTHIVVGFTDTFDTDISDARIIHPNSIQAQFQRKFYPNTCDLDEELNNTLLWTRSESYATNKILGKSERFPIGTTVALQKDNRIILCVAYARMDDRMVARASVDEIWHSLAKLWDSIDIHARREPVSMAIIGSQLAKVDSLDRASLIRLITLSFVARSRSSPVTNQLNIIIHPSDIEEVDMLELSAFLATV